MEIVLSAGLENFVTNHAVKIVKTDVTKTLAAARGGVYFVTLEIFVMKRATIDVYLVMNQELTTVSIDFIFFLNYAIFQTYLLFYFSLLHVTLKNVDFFFS